MKPNLLDALGLFSLASQYVHTAGLSEEVEWQRNSDFALFSESDLLREAAWVILCSGFRESVVQRHFDHLSLCFCDWESAEEIVFNADACRISAQVVFRNKAKLDAIISVARRIMLFGFENIRQAAITSPLEELKKLPFIGPITVLHLAKNLGLDVAKPDRHLVRLADRFGFADASDLCLAIGRSTGESTKVVDLILWRYVADNQSRHSEGWQRRGKSASTVYSPA